MFADNVRANGTEGIFSFTASEVPSEFPLVTTDEMENTRPGIKILPSSTIKVSNASGFEIYMLNSDYEWNKM